MIFLLDDFSESQFIGYSLIKNALTNDKLSHAYLINANHSAQAYEFVLAMVKAIICDNHYTNRKCCGECHKCARIDDNNYLEVKVIEPVSFVIKKEQLLELQSEFSRTGVEGFFRVYIIKDCDRMNKQASNCLLKFLEEPASGIIAILLTNQIANVLTTIISRCQVINLNNSLSLTGASALENFALLCNNNHSSVLNDLSDEDRGKFIQDVVDFLEYFEENGLDVLVFIKTMWYNKFPTKEDYSTAFLLMIYFFYDVLKCQFQLQNYFFSDYVQLIERIAQAHSVTTVVKRIEVALYGLDMIKCNLNMNLLLDDMIIRLGECDECS